MESIDDILATELLLLIAEQNNAIFISLRLISRSTSHYTGQYIDIYKRKFSIFIEKYGGFEYRILSQNLPDGTRHGSYWSFNVVGRLLKECEFKDGKIDGLCRDYFNSGCLVEHCYYKDNEEIKGSFGRLRATKSSLLQWKMKYMEEAGKRRKYYINGKLLGEFND